MEENLGSPKPKSGAPLSAELVINHTEEDARLVFGNSGLRLVFGASGPKEGDEDIWFMHFTPENSSESRPASQIKYSRMFAVGFLSLINTFRESSSGKLSALLSQHPIGKVSFNTNDTMWNFARKLLGEKYFVRIPQDFSVFESKLHEPIRKLLDRKGWPGDFLLADFLADYSADPSILRKCEQLADDKKVRGVKVEED